MISDEVCQMACTEESLAAGMDYPKRVSPHQLHLEILLLCAGTVSMMEDWFHTDQ